MAALTPVAMVMITAPVYVVLGEKGIAGSPSLWNLALDLCRVVTGLFGLLALVSVVAGRGSDSSRQDIFGSIASGVVFIAAAAAGLGLVIVVAGLGGLVLLYASGAVAVDAFRCGIGSRHVQTSCDTLDRREEFDAGDVIEPG